MKALKMTKIFLMLVILGMIVSCGSDKNTATTAPVPTDPVPVGPVPVVGEIVTPAQLRAWVEEEAFVPSNGNESVEFERVTMYSRQEFEGGWFLHWYDYSDSYVDVDEAYGIDFNTADKYCSFTKKFKDLDGHIVFDDRASLKAMILTFILNDANVADIQTTVVGSGMNNMFYPVTVPMQYEVKYYLIYHYDGSRFALSFDMPLEANPFYAITGGWKADGELGGTYAQTTVYLTQMFEFGKNYCSYGYTNPYGCFQMGFNSGFGGYFGY
jgi:hypothetical protein